MVPVLDINKQRLMPCTHRRAKMLIKKGAAKPFFQKGFFCIKLLREPSSRNSQPIVLGIDPGSKREGYTVLTKKRLVLNITTNTPDWVKEHIETRRNLRRTRRIRKTPYRACRENRSTLRKADRIPPSTKARWDAKFRIIKQLMSLMPITYIAVEDIQAITKKGEEQSKWNQSFSPLEIGKTWFYKEIEKLGVQLTKVSGKQTSQHRKIRGFQKSKQKLDYTWEAHNSDSHSIAEIASGWQVVPNRSMYQINFLEFHRRMLHRQNPNKGIRSPYGSTITLDISRGAVARYKDQKQLVYIGGCTNGRVAIHSIATGNRINQKVKREDVMVLYNSKQRMQYVAA